ncbi:MAG: pentapeptide repeat-containing protein, partial [Pseudomonadota bacterium]|nr:pentapeptide repeat-containing protein [Pseudomonadota bacterium]
MADTEERTVLKGQDAIDLWQQGADAWNAWVEKNPIADIDFSEVDFSKYADVSFARFRFPNGKKDFSETVFGDGNARFYDATFGEGDVSFYGATFVEGDVSFSAAKFGDGNVNFYRATFGKGNVRFSDTAFGNGWVSFHGATFGDGEVDFHGAAFGEGNVSFEGATFGVGAVSFIDAIFDAGSISFRGTIFGKGVITFADAILGKGSLIFDDASFKENSIVFRNADINGHLRLQNCRNTKTLRILSFRAMRLTGTFILEGNFTCVPDLRSTVMAAHVDLETSFIDPLRYKRRFPAFAFPQPAAYHAAQLRRLKELAEQNCHHEAALRFFALER